MQGLEIVEVFLHDEYVGFLEAEVGGVVVEGVGEED